MLKGKKYKIVVLNTSPRNDEGERIEKSSDKEVPMSEFNSFGGTKVV